MGFQRQAIRERMVETIRNGLTVDVNGYPYVKGVPQAPCFLIMAADEYCETERNLGPCINGTLNFEVWFLFRPGVSGEGQVLYDQLVDEARDALEDDGLMGGLGQLTTGNDRYRQRMQWGGTDGQTIFDWGVLDVAVYAKRV